MPITTRKTVAKKARPVARPAAKRVTAPPRGKAVAASRPAATRGKGTAPAKAAKVAAPAKGHRPPKAAPPRAGKAAAPKGEATAKPPKIATPAKAHAPAKAAKIATPSSRHAPSRPAAPKAPASAKAAKLAAPSNGDVPAKAPELAAPSKGPPRAAGAPEVVPASAAKGREKVSERERREPGGAGAGKAAAVGAASSTTNRDGVRAMEPAPVATSAEASPAKAAGPTPTPEANALPARAAGAPVPEAAPPAVEAAPAPKKRLAPRPKLEPWEPRLLPAPRLGRPEDPRLAAAIAARERWHGRSGRPALKSGTQAVAFARERRLVHLLEPSPLPNLLDPIVGRSCLAAEREEGPAATTFRGWRKEVDSAHDLLELRLAFERPTLAQAELWPSIAAVAEPLEQAARDGTLPLPREADEALEILDRKGSVPVERLRSLLGLGPKEMAYLQGQLEGRLLVLARREVDEDEGPITVLEPFGRWTARAVGPRRPELRQAFTVLFAAAVRSAAVLWPDEIAALFPWSSAERDAALAACLQAGAVVSYDEGGSVAYVASPVPR